MTTPQTPAQWAYAWIEALRSGRYEKTVGWLRNGDRFCGLGVLCDVAARNGVGAWGTAFYLGGGGIEFLVEAWDTSRQTLPHGVSALLGPRREVYFLEHSVFSANDHGGRSLDEIADIVEAWATAHGLFAATDEPDTAEHVPEDTLVAAP